MINKTIISLLFLGCLSLTLCRIDTEKSLPAAQKIKYRQYFASGKRLYALRCSNCHQKDGSGLARIYPPLQDSEYLKTDPGRTICIIRNGLKGEILVNDISFNQPMPASKDLSHLELAQLMTFLYSEWGEEVRIFPIADVAEMLENCREKENE